LAVSSLLILFLFICKKSYLSNRCHFFKPQSLNFILLRGYLLKPSVCLFLFYDLLFPPFGYALRNGEISSRDLGDDRAGVDADGPAGTFSSEALDARGSSV
jgi:hypothetical protein